MLTKDEIIRRYEGSAPFKRLVEILKGSPNTSSSSSQQSEEEERTPSP